MDEKLQQFEEKERQIQGFLNQYLTEAEKKARCEKNIELLEEELIVWKKELHKLGVK